MCHRLRRSHLSPKHAGFEGVGGTLSRVPFVDYLTNCRFDHADPVHQLNCNQFEAEGPVSLFVDLLKTQPILKSDSPRLGRRDNAAVANEEDSVFVYRVFLDALQFAGAPLPAYR